MIATYSPEGKSPGDAAAAGVPAGASAAASGAAAPVAPAANGSGYLNEVSALSARTVADGRTTSSSGLP